MQASATAPVVNANGFTETQQVAVEKMIADAIEADRAIEEPAQEAPAAEEATGLDCPVFDISDDLVVGQNIVNGENHVLIIDQNCKIFAVSKADFSGGLWFDGRDENLPVGIKAAYYANSFRDWFYFNEDGSPVEQASLSGDGQNISFSGGYLSPHNFEPDPLNEFRKAFPNIIGAMEEWAPELNGGNICIPPNLSYGPAILNCVRNLPTATPNE
jgi:hypothetical protein